MPATPTSVKQAAIDRDQQDGQALAFLRRIEQLPDVSREGAQRARRFAGTHDATLFADARARPLNEAAYTQRRVFALTAELESSASK